MPLTYMFYNVIYLQNSSKSRKYKIKCFYIQYIYKIYTVYIRYIQYITVFLSVHAERKYLAKISVEGALHNTINYHTRLKCSAFLSRHFYQDKPRPGLTDTEGSNKTRTLTPRLRVEKNKHFFCVYTINAQERHVSQSSNQVCGPMTG